MQPAPECIFPSSAADFWTAFSAIATFAAVVVALWPEIGRWRRRPKLEIIATMEPPACQRTGVFVNGHFSEFVYYMRIWIKNTGKLPAENVQVVAESMSRRSADADHFVPEDSFFPMNLRWTHSPPEASTFLERLNPQMGRHCELCHISGIFEMSPTEARVYFDLEVATVPRPAGTYRVALKAAGSNASPVTTTVEIVVSGRWDVDDRILFTRHLNFRVVKD
jgi:hypothetical protein